MKAPRFQRWLACFANHLTVVRLVQYFPGRPGSGVCRVRAALLHADAEPVLQLVERGKPSLLERLVPELAKHLL